MNKPTVSQKALRQLEREALEATAVSKPEKRARIFSQSRDMWEDRARRQIKTTMNGVS